MTDGLHLEGADQLLELLDQIAEVYRTCPISAWGNAPPPHW